MSRMTGEAFLITLCPAMRGNLDRSEDLERNGAESPRLLRCSLELQLYPQQQDEFGGTRLRFRILVKVGCRDLFWSQGKRFERYFRFQIRSKPVLSSRWKRRQRTITVGNMKSSMLGHQWPLNEGLQKHENFSQVTIKSSLANTYPESPSAPQWQSSVV
ncbi:hypothetical protein Y1Q_0014276 [Alligator mississippiensis]|uniref:Uncharacterized protein n=1 Tax=Alligator mississippiensis TaxID=8496 RepID=A0A151LZL4_ALLMI|nr:hypothetical protein Y1Q_0014276 [Alligator mississippiensis]